MSRPVVIYVDYENVRHWQRHAFSGTPHDFSVIRLGELLASRRREKSHLYSCRVYRGTPNRRLDNERWKTQNAWLERQKNDHRFVFVTQDMKYRRSETGYTPREKGVDVSLAIDLVMHPFRFPGCAAILLSRDEDLRPALRAFVEHVEDESPIEVATCRPLSRLYLGLTLSPWCHYLTQEDFELIREN